MRLTLLLVTLTVLTLLAGCGGPTPPKANYAPPLVEKAKQPPSEPAEPKIEVPPLPDATASAESDGNSSGTQENPAPAPDERSTERLILFLSSGPLVVELRMTIDAEPFRAVREELVDEVLKLADRDGDGRATWEEIYSDPKREFVQRFDVQTRNVTHKEFLRTNDTNQNGEIDREEARRIVSRSKSTGDAFSLDSSTEYRHSNRRHSIVRGLLDSNGDELLDTPELGAAETRLLARDANDDHIVTWDELDDSLAGDEQAMSARQNAYLNQPAAVRLGPRAAWDGIVYALSELYLSGDLVPDDVSPLVKSLADRLDADHDGRLTYEEVRGLDSVEPDLVLAANFGRAGDLLAGVSLVSMSDELARIEGLVAHSPQGLWLRLPEMRVHFVLDDRLAATGEQSAEAEFEALDKDKNGYLEKEEVSEASPAIAGKFDEVDENADGKVYLNELTAYRRRQQPQTTAIQALASDDQDVLFPLLDANSDGRLTKRELRSAPEALLVLDCDGDARISLDELPGSVTLWLTRGMPMNMPVRRRPFTVAEPTAPSGPDWFVHMDDNRDREVSLDEFPGTVEKFRSLDLDGDGFLSPSEALSAAP